MAAGAKVLICTFHQKIIFCNKVEKSNFLDKQKFDKEVFQRSSLPWGV
jgi:hypothetical protein